MEQNHLQPMKMNYCYQQMKNLTEIKQSGKNAMENYPMESTDICYGRDMG